VWRLAGYYHTTHATPRLMAEAAARFATSGRYALARYALEKVRDEGGHDELALMAITQIAFTPESQPAWRDIVARISIPSISLFPFVPYSLFLSQATFSRAMTEKAV